MKCYYEELCVDRDANDGDIKTAYRKLALKWHPDKNLNNLEEAKERFQLIQQAYEVLSDPQERAWYDNHREQILRGKNSNYEDNCLDVFQYFTVSCFKGFADDAKGFYAVYREVFEKIAAEDAEFMDDEEEMENIPKFGDSKSSYEEVVGPFYAYWSAYCTKRTYTWLCPYDIKEIKDRRILRQIEKDMKKVVQNAKKERNEEVRNLVSFIRKRDKRVQAYKKVLEDRAAFNRQKQEQNRLEQIRRRQQELQELKENSKSHHNDDYEEQLKQLEQEYSSDEDYYDEEEEDEDIEIEEDGDSNEEIPQDSEEEEYLDDLYCVACDKTFKNKKAIANHETSKKHQDNVEKLKRDMLGEENSYNKDIAEADDETKLNEVHGEEKTVDAAAESIEHGTGKEDTEKGEEIITSSSKSKNRKYKKDSKKTKQPAVIKSDDEDIDILEQRTSKIEIAAQADVEDESDWDGTNKKSSKNSKRKNKSTRKQPSTDETATASDQTQLKPETIKNPSKANLLSAESNANDHICVTCKSKFDSKNKLFSHLKLTNHGVYIPKPKTSDDDTGRTKKGKGKKK